jgi:tetratricopeptide (TPR) repeat protein
VGVPCVPLFRARDEMTAFVPTILVLCFLLPLCAAASEQSERLYSRGLVDLHAGRDEQATRLFDEAVRADPEDVYALYYRGTQRGRRGDWDGAIADLRAALAGKPDFDQAALDLGAALIEAGDFAAAVAPLQQAQRRSDLEAYARFYLGIAYLHLDDLQGARSNLSAAGDLDAKLAAPAGYYLGLVSQREGRAAEAQQQLLDVTRIAPGSMVGREAEELVRRMRGGRKPYGLYASAGFQYDSNVVLAGNDVGISDKDDGRAILDAGGFYNPQLSDDVQISLGYEFFQSLHFNLTEFNLQDHRPEMQIVGRWNALRLGLLTRYDFYLRDGSKFLQQATGSPFVSVQEGDLGRLDVYYRVRLRDFLESAFHDRDAVNQAPGIRQVVYLGQSDRYLSAGYQFDREDPNRNTNIANSFAYDGHEFNCGAGWRFPIGLLAQLDYAYRQERYPENSLLAFGGTSEGRLDKVHQLTVSFRQPVGEYFHLVVGYFGVFNGSNSPTFDYDRHIASLAVEATY